MLPHTSSFTHSGTGKHVSFPWSQHEKPVQKIQTHTNAELWRWVFMHFLFSPCSSGCQHMRVEVYTEYRSFLGNVMNDLENAYPYCLIFFESIIVGYQSKYRGVVLCLSQWLPCLNCWQESGCPSAWETDSSSIQYYTSASPPRPVKMPWWQGANIDRRAISQPIGWLWPIHFFHLPTLDMWFMWPLWASQSINLDCYWDHCACLLEGQRLVCNWEKFLCEKPNISIVS